MSGLSLFVIEDALTQLLEAREELTAGHPTDDTPAELAEVEKALAEYVAREVSKVDGIHSYLKYATLTAAAARQEAREYEGRARRLEANADRLKAICIDVMQTAGKTRLEGTCGRALAVQGNGGLAPLSVQEDILPPGYRLVTVRMRRDDYDLLDLESVVHRVMSDTPNHDDIRDAIRQGEDVPGAHLGERGKQLRVK